MTTVRVTRRPPLPEHARRRATPRPECAGAEAIRLALTDAPAVGTPLDGAWWPRSDDLSAELPGLVEELRRRGIRITRVAYHPEVWDAAPRRLAADGRLIRLGWFRSVDRQSLSLTGDLARRRLDLLVVPPGTPDADADRAFAAATDPGNREAPTGVLTAATRTGSDVSATS